MEQKIETFYPKNRKEWRDWLEENHDTKKSIWLIYYKIKSGIASVSYNDAVEEALCFGWIDSKAKTIDTDSYMQYYTKRKPDSVWSKPNKERVSRLIDEGLMTKSGFSSIEIAKQNGSWAILDEIDALLIPADLENMFHSKPGSMDYFQSLSTSNKKIILSWIAFAKRQETRQKRIQEVVESAYHKLKPEWLR